MVSLTVQSPHRKDPYRIQIGPQEALNSVKQYLVSLGQLQQPLTCFSLLRNGEPVDLFATVEELGLGDEELKVVAEPFSLGEVVTHVQQTRELLGFVPSAEPWQSLASGPTRVSFKTKKAPKPKERALTDKPDIPEPQILTNDLQPQTQVLVATPNSHVPAPTCRTLHYSCWHPPTFAQTLEGNLAFLKFVASDGKVFHISATTEGFYVNSSTDDKFDGKLKSDSVQVSLLQLIGRVSPRTLAAVERLNSQMGKLPGQQWQQPIASFLNAPWLVDASFTPTSDLARTQKRDVLKDWNEEFQVTRELNASETVRDRIIREKLLVQSCHDFAVAATKGAQDVVTGNITAFNPSDAPENRIYLRNGIFYTLAFDSVGTYADLGGDSAARIAALKDMQGAQYMLNLDLQASPVLTCVVDYCGRRIVAQGPVPGIFRENVEPDIVYGSSEGRSEVFSKSEAEQDAQKIAKCFHLKDHTAFSTEGQSCKLKTSVSTKIMNGSDGRRYVLDCARVTPVDLGFLSSHPKYPHKFALLRPEAVNEWFRYKVREELGERELTEELAAEYAAKFVVNPDCHLEAPKEFAAEYEADRKVVNEISSYLVDTIIPSYVSEISQGNTVYPLDGAQLTQGMHKRGISMRHLGLVAAAAAQQPALVEVIQREATARAVKHLINSRIEKLAIAQVQSAIVDFFKEFDAKAIKSETFARFGVDSEPTLSMKLLREISNKMGLQWNSELSLSNLKTSDLKCFVPRVRYSTLQSAIPEEAMAAGRATVATNKDDALDIVRESLSLHEQVYGIVHPETAKAYNQASLVYHELQDYDKAVEHVRAAICLSERLNGLDAAETIVYYINLGFYERARGNASESLAVIDYILKLWSSVGPENHPDLLNSLQNVATMLFQARYYMASIKWYELAINASTSDSDSAPLYLQLSQAHVIHNNAYATATRAAEKAFALYKSSKGPEDEGTLECKKWLDQLVNATVRDLKAKNIKMPVVKVQPQAQKPKSVDAIYNYIMGDEKKAKAKKGKKGKKSA